jgi:hypothetical protein
MPYLCINAKPIPGNYDIWLGELTEGEVYEGWVNEYGMDTKGNIGPCLVIPSITEEHGYDMMRFVETSNLDETALVTEEFKEKQLQTA